MTGLAELGTGRVPLGVELSVALSWKQRPLLGVDVLVGLPQRRLRGSRSGLACNAWSINWFRWLRMEQCPPLAGNIEAAGGTKCCAEPPRVSAVCGLRQPVAPACSPRHPSALVDAGKSGPTAQPLNASPPLSRSRQHYSVSRPRSAAPEVAENCLDVLRTTAWTERTRSSVMLSQPSTRLVPQLQKIFA